MTGRPPISRKSLSRSWPALGLRLLRLWTRTSGSQAAVRMRVPLPAATMRAVFIAWKSHLRSRTPIENFQLHGAGAVELVELRREGQVKASFRQRGFARIPPDAFADGIAIGDPKFGVAIVLPHPFGRTVKGEVADEKLGGRIADAGLLELAQFGQTLQREITQISLSIEAQGGL